MKVSTASLLLLHLITCSARTPFNPHLPIQSLLKLRGGQDDSPPSTYHGNYVAPKGEIPKAAQYQSAVAPAVVTQEPEATQTIAAAVVAQPVAPTPQKQNAKLSNFQERAPPAILMLGATYLLLRFLGKNGLIGLVLVMQAAMYSESTGVVDGFKEGACDGVIGSLGVQKWWWFVTALVATSGRWVLHSF
jgi:hypothetical protein